MMDPVLDRQRPKLFPVPANGEAFDLDVCPRPHACYGILAALTEQRQAFVHIPQSHSATRHPIHAIELIRASVVGDHQVPGLESKVQLIEGNLSDRGLFDSFFQSNQVRQVGLDEVVQAL